MKRLFPLFLILLPLLLSGCLRVVATHTYHPHQQQRLCGRCRHDCGHTGHRQYYRLFPSHPTYIEAGISGRGYYYHDYSSRHHNRRPQKVVQQNNYYSEHHYVTQTPPRRRSAKQYHTTTRSTREGIRQHPPSVDRRSPRRTVQHPTPTRRKAVSRSRSSQPKKHHIDSSRQRIQERMNQRRASSTKKRRQ